MKGPSLGSDEDELIARVVGLASPLDADADGGSSASLNDASWLP